MKVIHKKTNHILAHQLKIANTPLTRMVGLMFVKEMRGFDGLLLEPGNSIHNFFVRFPIDVLFLSKDMKIVKIIKCFKPWRISGIYFKARKVLELPNGTITDEMNVGDEIEVRYV